MFRFLTAGESHGPALTAIVDGVPAGLELAKADIDGDLARRQLGYGRGGRMKIEKDRAEIVSGVRHGLTLGSPITLRIKNSDWQNWKTRMAAEPVTDGEPAVTAPRPGHADLSGILKTGQKDIRNILERASARETAARVAVGAVAKKILRELGISVISHVVQVGPVKVQGGKSPGPGDLSAIDDSPMRCFDAAASAQMIDIVDKARADKDTVGGVFEVLIFGVLPGLGGYRQWDERLNAGLAMAIMSIPAIKAVEIGAGMELAGLLGSQAHDEIFHEINRGYYRRTNRAGGIEGGMSNGEVISVRAAMKPIPTLGEPLQSVDIATLEPVLAGRERSDICAVPAAAVIGEAVAAIEIVKAAQAKFGGDSIGELLNNFRSYCLSMKAGD